MLLIGLERSSFRKGLPLIHFQGWYRRTDETGAVSAFNINMLRRLAPYAYLFVPNDASTIEQWIDENAAYPDYVCTLDVHDIPHIPSPLIKSEYLPAPGAAFMIGQGDIGGVVDLINIEDQVLLCLPRHLSLVQVARLLESTEDGRDATIKALRGGGFIVTIIDGNAFEMWTMDPVYQQFVADGGAAVQYTIEG